MRKILIAILLFISFGANATTYYIDPSGSDITGTGAIGNPWKTLYKATSTVSGAGDIIHVNAGTYLETLQCSLAVGVSIEGDGVTSVIQSTYDDGTIFHFGAGLLLVSGVNTNGNQHISNVKFDGRNLAQDFAVDVKGRNNVEIYNCTFQNFYQSGIIMTGQLDNALAPPLVYATGCSFHDNIMSNCSRCDGVTGFGNFMFGGQDGMLIYNNTITQNQRANQTNGWPIKGWCESHIKNCKIYSNTLTTQPMVAGKANGEDGFWDFAIELFENYGNNEIYSNTMTGSLDINWQFKTIYPYSVYIHDNTIGFPTFQAGRQSGIILEYDVETAIIEDNTIRNCTDGVIFSTRSLTPLTNIEIRNNLMYNVGSAGGGYGQAIGTFTDGSANYTVTNMDIYNNTIVAHSNASYAPFWGIDFSDCGTVDNLQIKNNIVQGFQGAGIATNERGSWINSQIQYNALYLNANDDLPFPAWYSPTTFPGTTTVSNNFAGVNPLFVGGNLYLLDSITPSPLENAGSDGRNVGYTPNGGGGNNNPVANAGNDTAIVLPTNSLTITGTATDSDGTIVSTVWTQTSGNLVTITNGTTLSPTFSGLTNTIVVRLTVTDNLGATHYDERTITVTAAPAPPASGGIILRGIKVRLIN